MKVSKLVTKIVLRVFFILLAVAAFVFFQADKGKFDHIYFGFAHWWQMVFPAIIIVSFIILVITCTIKRYNEPQLNWLLVVNTVVLIAYGFAIFIKVSHMV
jgi:hypothetical protein